MGAEVEKLYGPFTSGENTMFDIEIMKFDEQFTLRRNSIHERADSHQHAQQPGENVEQYVRALYELAKLS